MARIKTLLVYAERSDAGAELLSQAAAFAGDRDAHLVALVLGLQPTPTYASLPDVPLDAYFVEFRAAREAVDEAARWTAERLAGRGISHEVRGVVVPMSEAGRMFARHARYADLAVFPRGNTADNWHQVVDGALFDSGKPLLLVPPGKRWEGIGGRVVVAWDAGAEAARAVSCAIDLLGPQSKVHVVTVDPRVSLEGHGEEPGADLASMLARHGLDITVDAIPRENQSVAEALLRHAQAVEADMLVAGAYGHSRLSEIFLGGATRDLMEYTDRPLLMAH